MEWIALLLSRVQIAFSLIRKSNVTNSGFPWE